MRLNTNRCAALVHASLVLAHSGCSAPLPTHAWSTPEEALTIMKERAASITTVQAPCDLVLTSPNGESVRLEGALVARNPGWLRIRAWKFNMAVFDLTMKPEGLWIMQNDSSEFRDRVPATLNADAIARGWTLLNGRAIGEAVLQDADQRGSRNMTMYWPDESGVRVSCVVDRRTLLAQRIEAIDGNKALEACKILLEDYRMVDGIAWPHTLTMISDVGKAVVRMHSVALNQDIAVEAFLAPSRAVKQP